MNRRNDTAPATVRLFPAGVTAMILSLCMAGMTACGLSEESRIEQEVAAFSDTYFNWQFHRSVPHCTPESRKWLSFMASQVSRSDLDRLRAFPEGASCEVGDVIRAANDSAALVEVTVSHFLQMDTIGHAAHRVERARFRIPVRLQAGKWKVSLTAPLRAEKE